MTALIVLSLALLGQPLLAADGALTAVSTEAGAVLRLKAPKATIDSIASFVDMIQPGIGNQIRVQAQGIGMAISNPTLGGVDMNKDWYLAAFFPGGEAQPQVVFVIPATDLKEMKEALGETLGDDKHFIEHKTWGVYSNDEEIITKVKGHVKESGKSISTLFDKESLTTFDQGDLSLFLNLELLVTTYKDKIDELQQTAAALLEKAADQQAEVQGIDLKSINQIGGNFLSGLVQGLQDSKSFVTAITITQKNITIEDVVRVKEGSKADKYLARSKASDLSLLGALPADELVYMGLSVDTKGLLQLASKLMSLNPNADEEGKQELTSLIQKLSELNFGTFNSSWNLTPDAEAGLVESTSVAEVDAPQKLRELLLQTYKVAAKAKTPGIKQTYDIKEKAETFGKNSADVVTVKMEAEEDDDNPQAAIVQRILGVFYGEEGIVTRGVYLDKLYVQTTGGGKKAMTQALESATGDTRNSSEAFTKARGQLNKTANLLVLIDLPNLAANAIQIASKNGLFPVPVEKSTIEGLQLKPSYLGFAIGAESQTIRCKTNIPVEQIQGIFRLGTVAYFMMQQQQGNNDDN